MLAVVAPAALLVLPSLLVSAIALYWEQLLTRFSEYDLIFGGLYVLTVGCYWICGLLFHAVDRWASPASLAKLQPMRTLDNQRITMWELCSTIALGQVFILGPYSVAQVAVHSSSTIPLSLRVDTTLPPASEVLVTLALLVLLEECCFYYSHRLLHTAWLYRHVHKQHHTFTSPVALAAVYAHPLEVATGNVLPLVLSPLMLNAHLFTVVVWYVFAIVGVQWHHCGYNLFPRQRTSFPVEVTPCAAVRW